MRQGLASVWLVLIVAACCLPLFVGLGRTDLGNDEAIYSYAVESILDTGDWLSPRSSPNGHITFLEKPPLKFWIVAAPIHLGLLPGSEFGLRFWDAAMGGIAFVYVFLIGRSLAGSLCGAFAVLVLFAHEPLIFEHGVRSNNMEAALLLSYAGGIYHFGRWGSAVEGARGSLHVAAVTAFFFLGFMTKFVAALFLPVVLGSAVVLVPVYRRGFIREWRHWMVAALAFVAAAAPWFVYQYLRQGRQIWLIMFGEHVYTRFTAHVDPTHLEPWHYYFSQMFVQLHRSGAAWWAVAGLVLLGGEAVRRREAGHVLVLLWAIVPASLISIGSSKVYHYAYPFVPPVALAAGFAAACLWSAARRLGTPAVERLERVDASWRLPAPVRAAGAILFVAATVVAAATALTGPLRVQIADGTVFRNAALFRPLAIAAGGLALAGGTRALATGLMVLALAFALPTPLEGYARTFARLSASRQPIGVLADCIRDVDRTRKRRGEAPAGVYAPVSHRAFNHPYFYYLRGNGWHREPDDDVLSDALFVRGRERPVAIDHDRYRAFFARHPERVEPVTVAVEGILVALPGPYEMCIARQGRPTP